MPRATEIKPDLSDLSILLIGDSGSGKTRLIGDISEVKSADEPADVLLYDFDKGAATIRGKPGVEYFVFKDAPEGGRAIPAEGVYPYGTAWLKFLDHLNQVGEQIDKGTCSYKAMAFDSATALTSICMNSVLKGYDKYKPGLVPDQPCWGTFLTRMRSVTDQLTSWPLVKVMTAHVERASNPLTESMELLPFASGKFQPLMPTFFDEVYYCEVADKPDTRPGQVGKRVREFRLITEKNGLYKAARSRWGVPNHTETKWSAVKSAIINSKANA